MWERTKLIKIKSVRTNETLYGSTSPGWSAECEKPTSAPLIAPVVRITLLPLPYHVRKFYIACYTFSKTHPSQPTHTFNELQKKRGKKKGKNCRCTRRLPGRCRRLPQRHIPPDWRTHFPQRSKSWGIFRKIHRELPPLLPRTPSMQ